jgi:hypothetical protein
MIHRNKVEMPAPVIMTANSPMRRQMGGWPFSRGERPIVIDTTLPPRPPKRSTVAAVVGKSEFNTLRNARNTTRVARNRLNAQVNMLTREYAGRDPFSLSNNHPWKRALRNYASANNAYTAAESAFKQFLDEHPGFRLTNAPATRGNTRRHTRRHRRARRGITRS